MFGPELTDFIFVLYSGSYYYDQFSMRVDPYFARNWIVCYDP